MRARLIRVAAMFVGCVALPFIASAQKSPLSSRYLFTQANASAPAPIVRAGDDKVPNEYIVVFKDDVPPEQISDLASQLAADFGATVKKVWSHAVKGIFARMTETQAQALTAHPLIKYIEENAGWYLSAGPYQTNVDPKACDPTAGTCPTVVDDRLWHLDRADQNYASPTSAFSYCTDGTGVTVYVVDTGINKFHNEFTPSGTRVQPGVNTSGDFMPADDPCMGFAIPASGGYSYLEAPLYPLEVMSAGHGTSVASALGGNRVGLAKKVTIVPVKTARCDRYSARYWLPAHYYQQNETMFRSQLGASIDAFYRALNSGYSSGTDPTGWPYTDNATFVDNQITWQVIPRADWQNPQTTQMLIDGLNWILSPSNPGPKSYAVVTLSTFRVATEAGVAGPSGTVEAAIRSLLASNMTVIASANNQNGNACDTSPARMSMNNPDPSVANNVITAGGSMIVNRPWTVDISDVSGSPHEADGPKAGGGYYGVEPAYNPAVAVRDTRWICGAGDSSQQCSNPTATSTMNPANITAYQGYEAGSNAGACVTLFAPAKNLFLASVAGASEYRDARLRGANASGTSWSAPIVAGFAARILQSNPTYTPVQVRTVMLDNSVSTLDAATLNTYDYNGIEITGTPNKLLRLSDVNIVSSPASTPAVESGTTPLTVSASGAVSYEWYEANADFDYATYKNGAYSSTQIAGATSSTFDAPVSSVRKAYWARVKGFCGSADSDIAVVVPRPGPPSNVNAVASGTNVTVTWSAGSGAEAYQIERKIAGQAWTMAGQVDGSVLTFTETPSVPGGMVVYRVFSVAGAAYLPPQNVAKSSASNNDFANVNSSTYEPLIQTSTTIKAQHLIELRQALNGLCDAVGIAQEYGSGDLQLSALQGQVVNASDFTSLMTHINNVRRNAALSVGEAAFTETPAAGVTIKTQHLQELRDALK